MARNKPHKQKFSSKRAVSNKAQGRVPKKDKVAPRKGNAQQSKGGNAQGHKVKKQQAAQALKRVKIAKVEEKQSVGCEAGPPRIVGVIPINESANAPLAYSQFLKVCGQEATPPSIPVTIGTLDGKNRITLVCEAEGNEQDMIDVAKVADVLIMAIDVSAAAQDIIRSANTADTLGLAAGGDGNNDECVSTWFDTIGLCVTTATRELIQCLNAQGSPTPIVLLQGLASHDDPRRRAATRRIHERYFASLLCSEQRVVSADNPEELEALLRVVLTCRLRTVHWREMRPYFVVDDASYDEERRELCVAGYIRGQPLAATQLVHLTGYGTYQIERILADIDPCPPRRPGVWRDGVQPGHSADGDDDAEGDDDDEDDDDGAVVIDEAEASERAPLEACLVNDTVENEQTWPTEDDVTGAQRGEGLLVPEGVSEYQAMWYENEARHAPLPTSGAAAATAAAPQGRVAGDHDDVPLGLGGGRADFDNMSMRTGMTQGEVDFRRSADILAHERLTDAQREAEVARLREESGEEARNPDEVDTPFRIPARQRFAKYRGMKSFGTSVWDPNENLPVEYARIFKLQGYQQIRDAAVRAYEDAPAEVGRHVQVVLRDVGPNVWKHARDVMLASGLLDHEQRWSVVHFQVKRSQDYNEPIKSKTAMLAHVGFRKMYIKPIFSDVTTGDRTKYSRYFHEGENFRLATFFGPISYHPCSILLFKAVSIEEENEGTPLRMVAYGGAAPPNPDLLILKRTVLTGRFAVIYTKVSVVKFMFHNDEDVKWFMPVDLYTRLGRRGKILKAIGSHGLFKATFSDQVQQHDVVCMDLYKRVYPKWDTVPVTIDDIVARDEAGNGGDEDGAVDADEDGDWEDEDDE